MSTSSSFESVDITFRLRSFTLKLFMDCRYITEDVMATNRSIIVLKNGPKNYLVKLVTGVEKDVAYVLIIWRTSENETNTQKMSPSERLRENRSDLFRSVCIIRHINALRHRDMRPLIEMKQPCIVKIVF